MCNSPVVWRQEKSVKTSKMKTIKKNMEINRNTSIKDSKKKFVSNFHNKTSLLHLLKEEFTLNNVKVELCVNSPIIEIITSFFSYCTAGSAVNIYSNEIDIPLLAVNHLEKYLCYLSSQVVVPVHYGCVYRLYWVTKSRVRTRKSIYYISKLWRCQH